MLKALLVSLVKPMAYSRGVVSSDAVASMASNHVGRLVTVQVVVRERLG
jgi:hypothetical protein